ncbi:MAG: phosphate ABC transporter permease subunit PstC [Armatimonadota bacterium]
MITNGRTNLPSGPLHGTGGRHNWRDSTYLGAITIATLILLALVITIGSALIWQSLPAIRSLGVHYLTSPEWDDAAGKYGSAAFLSGTLYSSLLATLVSVPLSICSAIFLVEIAPKWIRLPVTFIIELLAAIPSVVYGLWGICVLIPVLRDKVMAPALASPMITKIPLVKSLLTGAGYGPSVLAAGLLLAIMITPFITAICRDILNSIPSMQRDAAAGMGCTQSVTIIKVVLPSAAPGLIGAVMLGFGRAFGETMAVTMVIGNMTPNTPDGKSFGLFDPGYTIASAMANKFTEATPGIATAALIELGLVLFVTSMLINFIARSLVKIAMHRLG